MLAAFDDDAARDLLRAVLARAGEREVAVPWITVDAAVGDRRLPRRRARAAHGRGAVFLDGDVGPFTPYLPSGAFL